MSQCLLKEYTLSILISFLKVIEINLILMDFSLYLVQVLTSKCLLFRNCLDNSDVVHSIIQVWLDMT